MANGVKWTAKFPLLMLGGLLWIAALVLTARGRIALAALVGGLALVFTVYSFTIKDWCKPQLVWGQSAWTQGAFSGSFGDCWRKSWLAF